MKKLDKKQMGGPKIKIKEKTSSGNYVKTTRTYNDANNKGESTSTRRTVKGVLKGAARIKPNYGGVDDSYELNRTKNMENNREMKKGGRVKAKKK